MKTVSPAKQRDVSLLTGKGTLEHLYTFPRFPVYMGCTDSPVGEDMVSDMIWDMCTETGMIQLRNLLPLDVLYMHQHNDGTGSVWKEHYAAFADFVARHDPKRVLEIGGAHDHIARQVMEMAPETRWTIVEPNPQYVTDGRIRVVKGWFDGGFRLDTPVDTIVHSHVFEHSYDPVRFIEHIGSFLKEGEKHIFSFPHLRAMLEKKWTNCLNFEHTAFLTEEITEHILARAGFAILSKQYFGDPHSIFYATEKREGAELHRIPNRYDDHKRLYMDYIDFHSRTVQELNVMTGSDVPTYLFGAHIFSQVLIQFGLTTDQIVCVLDNSPLKIGKRLYGTSLRVSSPEELRGKGRARVIVRAGIYNDEITRQLRAINPHVECL